MARKLCHPVGTLRRLPRIFSAERGPAGSSRLTVGQCDSNHDFFSTHSGVNYLPTTKPARRHCTKGSRKAQMAYMRAKPGTRLWRSPLGHGLVVNRGNRSKGELCACERQHLSLSDKHQTRS